MFYILLFTSSVCSRTSLSDCWSSARTSIPPIVTFFSSYIQSVPSFHRMIISSSPIENTILPKVSSLFSKHFMRHVTFFRTCHTCLPILIYKEDTDVTNVTVTVTYPDTVPKRSPYMYDGNMVQFRSHPKGLYIKPFPSVDSVWKRRNRNA